MDKKIREYIEDLPPDVRKVVDATIKFEREELDKEKPRVKDNIKRVIQNEIKIKRGDKKA